MESATQTEEPQMTNREIGQQIVASTDPRDQALVDLCKKLERKLHGKISPDFDA